MKIIHIFVNINSVKMKRIIIILSLFLSSCEIYQQPTSLSLSGEYIIDRITKTNTENGQQVNLSYYPGDVYINTDDSFPLNQINVGFTRWSFDYMFVYFNPTMTSSGRVIWEKQYPYFIINHYSVYDLGYVKIDMDGGTRIFKVIEDGYESLVLRNTGLWPYGSIGSNQLITIHLTRVGP